MVTYLLSISFFHIIFDQICVVSSNYSPNTQGIKKVTKYSVKTGKLYVTASALCEKMVLVKDGEGQFDTLCGK
jgi:hypothetical protein